MKITVLGCGTSGGVPLIGNRWGACDPSEPRNRRRRASILVEQGNTTVLVDVSPDVRAQLLDCNLQDLTAVVITHAHADHCHGIDDLRAVNWLTERFLPFYAERDVLDELSRRFDYIFKDPPPPDRFYKPGLEPQVIDGPFQIGDISIVPFQQNHGRTTSLGLRFGDFAYSTDVLELDEAAFAALDGVRYWIVDALRERPHPTHAHLPRTLEWIARVRPERAWLTHMDMSMDYRALCASLPAGVEPAYDGLTLNISINT